MNGTIHWNRPIVKLVHDYVELLETLWEAPIVNLPWGRHGNQGGSWAEVPWDSASRSDSAKLAAENPRFRGRIPSSLHCGSPLPW